MLSCNMHSGDVPVREKKVYKVLHGYFEQEVEFVPVK